MEKSILDLKEILNFTEVAYKTFKAFLADTVVIQSFLAHIWVKQLELTTPFDREHACIDVKSILF